METKKKQLEIHDMMVGDLVTSKEGICRVSDVWYDNMLRVRYIHKRESGYLYKGEFNGIEIKKRFLLDNGFERTHNKHKGIAYSMNCDGHEIDIVGNQILITSIENEDIDPIAILILPRYVHEFQHILRLFGHSDLANNFTVR